LTGRQQLGGAIQLPPLFCSSAGGVTILVSTYDATCRD
jgi:hypothetical protein